MKRTSLFIIGTLFSFSLLLPTNSHATASMNIDVLFDLGNLTILGPNNYDVSLWGKDTYSGWNSEGYIFQNGGLPIDYQFANTIYSADMQANPLEVSLHSSGYSNGAGYSYTAGEVYARYDLGLFENEYITISVPYSYSVRAGKSNAGDFYSGALRMSLNLSVDPYQSGQSFPSYFSWESFLSDGTPSDYVFFGNTVPIEVPYSGVGVICICVYRWANACLGRCSLCPHY